MGRPKVYRKFEQVPCACGCGGIVTTPDKQGAVVRYLFGHYWKGKRGARWGKGKYADHRGEKQPCACGCGELVEIYCTKGLKRYVAGHQLRGKPSCNPLTGKGKKNSVETKLCKCGCGTVIPKYDAWSREREYANGHIWKGRHGPMLGRKQPDSQREKLSLYRTNHPETIKNRYGVRTQYNGVWFRSRIEAKRAQELDALGYHWQYEQKSLEYVGDDRKTHRYVPDFWIEELNRFEEVKGYFPKEAKRKMELVKQFNPGVVIELLERRK